MTGEAADLGCGNGVLGLSLAADNPQVRVTFCDVSWLAVESARDNAAALFGPSHRHEFHLGHGLDGLERRFDLILLNPPFHRGHAVDDGVARTLFRHARRHLAPAVSCGWWPTAICRTGGRWPSCSARRTAWRPTTSS